MGQQVAPREGWFPDPSVHAGYAYSCVPAFAEHDRVWVPAWDCLAMVVEVTHSGGVRVTDTLVDLDGSARWGFFQENEVEAR